ncbi:hypothetical protein [Hymenobacter negativus]|uniref:DUF3303 domain-containing protein n=1 Tax=Hymenobacter negativus TaxID=2795026 RepID=A0ABS0Q8K3_9BACT|nr:hypothetical protein [Hymenobacter negativus]MBH8559006.1 hypothetical protein [Hymenobacter negativus]
MTFYQFSLLPNEAQLATVHAVGNYLARRWDDVHQAVMLYQMPGGFFVELNYDVDQNKVTHLFAFEAGTENDRLEDYAMFVKLPDWLSNTD